MEINKHTTIEKGDIITAFAQPGGFYKKVKGEVIERKGYFIQLRATEVISRWSDTWKEHPTSCVLSVTQSDVLNIENKK